MNLVHLDGIDGTDPDDLTRGEIEGRRQAMHAIEALRRYTPGCDGARLRNFGMTLGIRDTRKIDAVYNMTEHDVRDAGTVRRLDRDLPRVHRRLRDPDPADDRSLLPAALPQPAARRAFATCWSPADRRAATGSRTRRPATCRAVRCWAKVPASLQHCRFTPALALTRPMYAIQKELDRQGVRYE